MLRLLLVKVASPLAKRRSHNREYHKPNLRPKCDDSEQNDNRCREASTDLPKVVLRSQRVPDICKIRTPIGRKEGEREEDNGYGCEDQNSLVASVVCDGEIVLLDCTKSEELKLRRVSK